MGESRRAHPELYRRTFAADGMGWFSGGAVVTFPWAGVMAGLHVAGTLASQGLPVAGDFQNGFIGALVGLAVAGVVNLIYVAKLRDSRAAAPKLIAAAKEMYPEARVGFGEAGLVFSAQ